VRSASRPLGTPTSSSASACSAEIDLLSLPGSPGPWAIEIKRGLVELGFHHACEDVQPARRWVAYAGTERCPLGKDLQAIPLGILCAELRRHEAR